MIFDFKRNRIALLFGIIAGSVLVVVLTLQESDTQTMVLAVAFMLFLLWFILRRMTIKEIQGLQYAFMIERNAEGFKMAYDQLLRKGTAFDKRWVITKHQNYILGSIFNGDEEDARMVLDNLENNYGEILHKQPVYHYLDAVIKALISLYYEEENFIIESLNLLKERFESLPEQMQKQMSENINSFHYFFKVLDEEIFTQDQVDTEAFESAIETMTPFLQTASMMVLKRKGIKIDEILFEERQGKLFKNYTLKPL